MPDGVDLGTLSVMDRMPRAVTEQQVEDLTRLEAIVVIRWKGDGPPGMRRRILKRSLARKRSGFQREVSVLTNKIDHR